MTAYHFTTATCLELLDNQKLTVPQVTRELMQIGKTKEFIDALGNADAKKDFLRTAVGSIVSKTVTDTTDKILSLTENFSRSAAETAQNLKDSMAEANTLLDSLRKLRPPHANTPREVLPFPSTSEEGTPPAPSEKPYTSINGKDLLQRFDVASLDDELEFDYTFANRKVAYWGDFSYKYAGGYHAPKPKPTGPIFTELITATEELCKQNGIDFKSFNSCLITKYDTPHSSLPPHSDDEPCIVPGSDIFTVSLGGTRDILFRRLPPAEECEETLTVSHGDCYLMSRASQDIFDHSVKKRETGLFDGARISLTFRQLRNPKLHTPSRSGPAPTFQQSTKPKPKRVLILSDSKNASFDCSQFRGPIIAFRRNLFFLRDLNSHREAIEQADIVLISSGINDLEKNHAPARLLHDHVRDFVAQFPRTEFLFDSVSAIALRADPHRLRNDRIDDFNELMFHLSLHTAHFKLFDNPNFGTAHLAADGLHMNQSGQQSMSDCWINCILLRLGFRRGPLPIRMPYQHLHRKYARI